MAPRSKESISGSPPDRNVLGGEPHALTDPVGRRRDALRFDQLLHPEISFDEVAVCDPPGLFTPLDECLGRGDSHLLLLAGEQGELVA